MDSRAAAHLLHEIVALLELQGEDPAVPAPFADAARSLAADEPRPVDELLRRDKRRFAPEVVEVLEELNATGDAALLDRDQQAIGTQPPAAVEFARKDAAHLGA